MNFTERLKAWCLDLGWPERLLAIGVLVFLLLIASGSRVLGTLVGLIVAGLIFVCICRFMTRFIRRKIWWLRNRLVVSYIFVAIVPMALLLVLAAIGAYVLIGQMAIYAVNTELDHRTAGHNPPPELTPDFLSSLIPDLGSVSLLEIKGDTPSPVRRSSLQRDPLPAPANRLDIELTWFSLVSYRDNPIVLTVRSRPSAVLRVFFGKSLDPGFAAGLAGVVAGLFLLALLISIVIGVSLTRTITGAVGELYEGTLRIREGDLSHRIQVKGSDQLATLSTSFNGMTENLQRLIEVEKERERLHSELEIARQVQGRLFPKSAPKLSTLKLLGLCEPAQAVSGDYYDYLTLPDGDIALAIGDVSGKGISAALLMAAIQSVMRTQLTESRRTSPAEVVALLNRQLYATTSPEKYCTFCFGIYNDVTGLLTYTNAGHLPPILVRNGRAGLLEVTGTVVGAFPAFPYESRQITLDKGDLLVAYTDGITEPENSYGEMFGEERLMEIVSRNYKAEPSVIIGSVMDAVKEWAACPEQADDMTLVVAQRI